MKFTRKQIKIFALRTIVNFRRYEIEKRHNKKKRLTINSFPKIFGKGVIKPEGFGQLRRRYIRRAYTVFFVWKIPNGKKLSHGVRISDNISETQMKKKISEMKLTSLEKRIKDLSSIKNIISRLLTYPHYKQRHLQTSLERQIQFFYAMKYWKMMKKKCLKLKSKLASKKPEKNPLLSTNAAVDIFKEFSSSEQYPSSKSSFVSKFLI